jgi:hypothetical protein
MNCLFFIVSATTIFIKPLSIFHLPTIGALHGPFGIEGRSNAVLKKQPPQQCEQELKICAKALVRSMLPTG